MAPKNEMLVRVELSKNFGEDFREHRTYRLVRYGNRYLVGHSPTLSQTRFQQDHKDPAQAMRALHSYLRGHYA